jgi:hypothetical protein
MGKTTLLTKAVLYAVLPQEWFNAAGASYAIVTQKIIAHFSSVDYYRSTYGKPLQISTYFWNVLHLTRSNVRPRQRSPFQTTCTAK